VGSFSFVVSFADADRSFVSTGGWSKIDRNILSIKAEWSDVLLLLLLLLLSDTCETLRSGTFVTAGAALNESISLSSIRVGIEYHEFVVAVDPSRALRVARCGPVLLVCPLVNMLMAAS
jgi:hypothetical protein